MGVAERRQHAPEVGGYILHYYGEHAEFYISALPENGQCKRQKSQQRHIVGNEHGENSGDEDQSRNQLSLCIKFSQKEGRRQPEYLDISECRDHRHESKQTEQCFRIYISQILLVYRHPKNRNHRYGDSDEQHGFTIHKSFNFSHDEQYTAKVF